MQHQLRKKLRFSERDKRRQWNQNGHQVNVIKCKANEKLKGINHLEKLKKWMKISRKTKEPK